MAALYSVFIPHVQDDDPILSCVAAEKELGGLGDDAAHHTGVNQVVEVNGASNLQLFVDSVGQVQADAVVSKGDSLKKETKKETTLTANV